MDDILAAFARVEPIGAGLSADKKYRVTKADGERLFLRVADIAEYGRKKAEYEMLERVCALGVPVPRPAGFGVCGGVYALTAWIDGESAETVLPTLPEAEQYALGWKAGRILRQIHAVPIPAAHDDWESQRMDRIDARLAALQNGGVDFDGRERILDYLDRNRALPEDRPRSFRHGDYSAGNILVTPAREIVIVDWETDESAHIGDPWRDFVDVVWGADISPRFASGAVRGYWDGAPPGGFWDVVMYYTFMDVTAFIESAAQTGPDRLENEIAYCEKALMWFDGMRNPVPIWYQGSKEA